ncbi:XdhC family protein [Flavobacteriaceae bacterium F89]|uniref:XdhC family protein n=1 Tax=Cerina litoralis TaxID=2874477 RepID=A0AAE3EVD0_9FLAO|nr:XdhC family protein [Cerina litoralis]MCG2460356.1 XdhC family protein [Cerina litoralis]
MSFRNGPVIFHKNDGGTLIKMTHELIKIIGTYRQARAQGQRAVLATVVALEGSSYRRPGVRMLILEDGGMVGAVSGGCVEKEVRKQATPVFNSGIPKMMTYDGRYRLGCEGILYILLEPFEPSENLLEAFSQTLQERLPFTVSSRFEKSDGESPDFGSFIRIKGANLYFRAVAHITPNKKNVPLLCFDQDMEPCFQLVIFGAEHDAVQLCSLAAMLGWEVTVTIPSSEGKQKSDFPGSSNFMEILPEDFPLDRIDSSTAVMLMNHGYVKDLKCLIALKDIHPAYLGLLGPAKRRERLLNELMELEPQLRTDFMEQIHGPAGLNIGAETPQEIAVAILSEILSVVRKQNPIFLRNKPGSIHN